MGHNVVTWGNPLNPGGFFMATSSINGGYIINSASRLVTFPTWIECCLMLSSWEIYRTYYRCALGLSRCPNGRLFTMWFCPRMGCSVNLNNPSVKHPKHHTSHKQLPAMDGGIHSETKPESFHNADMALFEHRAYRATCKSGHWFINLYQFIMFSIEIDLNSHELG